MILGDLSVLRSIASGARISDDGLYRHYLWRSWWSEGSGSKLSGKPLFRKRAAAVLRPIRSFARALGFTKSGHPRHPLYVRSDAKLEHFA